jgi:uncharacterized membrane protein YwzB
VFLGTVEQAQSVRVGDVIVENSYGYGIGIIMVVLNIRFGVTTPQLSVDYLSARTQLSPLRRFLHPIDLPLY